MPDGYPEHRRHERKSAPSSGLVQVYRISPSGNEQKVGASLLHDISLGGVSILIDSSVEIGEVLLLKNRSVHYFARVRRCGRREAGFFAGLEFCPAPKRYKETNFGPAGSSSRKPHS